MKLSASTNIFPVNCQQATVSLLTVCTVYVCALLSSCRSLSESRDSAFAERDRALAAERELNSKYEHLMNEYVTPVLYT